MISGISCANVVQNIIELTQNISEFISGDRDLITRIKRFVKSIFDARPTGSSLTVPSETKATSIPSSKKSHEKKQSAVNRVAESDQRLNNFGNQKTESFSPSTPAADLSYIHSICPSKRLVLYGFSECKWFQIERLLKKTFTVYLYDIGYGSPSPFMVVEDFSHLTENKIAPIPIVHSESSSIRTARVCKTALVYLVLDNYRRSIDNKEITPLVFCIDSNFRSYPIARAETIFSKDIILNTLTTHKELRRLGKLCFDPSIDSRIRQVALRMCKFVRVEVDPVSHEITGFQGMPMPFTKEEVLKLSAERRKGKTAYKPNAQNWRVLMEERRIALDAAFVNRARL